MAGTYEPIASTTLTSAASSITFSDIAADWTDLIVTFSASENTGNVRGMHLRLNSDEGSNYSGTFLIGTGSAASSARDSNETWARPGRYLNINGRAIGRLHVQNYANTNVYKAILGEVANQEDTYNPGIERDVYLWRSTSAINALTFIAGSPAQFAAGCTFSLFGIKAA